MKWKILSGSLLKEGSFSNSVVVKGSFMGSSMSFGNQRLSEGSLAIL